MNREDAKYSKFALVREMMDTVDVVQNLLVEIGLALNINLDKPERARKVGNEFISK